MDPLDTSISSSTDASQGLESLAIGASADTFRVLASPHADFSQPVEPLLQGDALAGRAPLIRRETAQVSDDAQQRIFAASASADALSQDTGDDELEGDKHVFQEDPRFTAKAIFSNKHLAPELAEFLGHLAERAKNEHKKVNKAASEAGLIAQGSAKAFIAGDDDSDDLEDMQKLRRPKNTPLSNFLEQLDAKTTAAAWSPSDCSKMSKNVTEKYEQMFGRKSKSYGAGPRSEIHTGMFFRHWKISKHQMKNAARKLRLSVLSFLATQDAGKVKLHIWTDLDKRDKRLEEVLGPILSRPELMDSINITTFNPKTEFGMVPPTMVKEALVERYRKNTMPNLRSDLYRSIILYNHGGMWMDADTVLMQDVAPLLGEDWAHLVKGKEGAIEGALLSASHPRSHFTNEYLISMVMRTPAIDERSEPEQPVLQEVFESDPAHSTMHVLPPCFFDSDQTPKAAETAVLSSDASLGSNFFGEVVAEKYRAFFSIGMREAVQDTTSGDVSVLQDPSLVQPSEDLEDERELSEPTSPSWAYHWRGNFAASWARGSLADVAERTFMKKLQLSKHF